MKKVAFLFVTTSALVGALIACGDAKPAQTANDVTNTAGSGSAAAASAVPSAPATAPATPAK